MTPINIEILNQDCRAFLKNLESSSVDLILTSPPYSMGKSYEQGNKLDTFLQMHSEIFPELYRILRPGGSLCWQIGYHVKERVCEPLDFLVHEEAKKFTDLKLRNRLIWTFGHGEHAQKRFSGRHETLMWYSKGDNYYFDLNSVRVPQKYPGKKHYKGPKKGEYSGHPAGKNPTDVWEIPNVKGNHVEKLSHPCQFPVALAARVVCALSPPAGLVIDPFAGSGTTAVACALYERHFEGADVVSEYVAEARKRVADARVGKVRYREDRAVLDPQDAGRVANRPEHFEWGV